VPFFGNLERDNENRVVAKDLTMKQRRVIDLMFGKDATMTEAVRQVYLSKCPTQLAQQIKKSPRFREAFNVILDKIGLSDLVLGLKMLEHLGATKKQWDPSKKEWFVIPDFPTQQNALRMVYQMKGGFDKPDPKELPTLSFEFQEGEVVSAEEENRNLQEAERQRQELEPSGSEECQIED